MVRCQQTMIEKTILAMPPPVLNSLKTIKHSFGKKIWFKNFWEKLLLIGKLLVTQRQITGDISNIIFLEHLVTLNSFHSSRYPHFWDCCKFEFFCFTDVYFERAQFVIPDNHNHLLWRFDSHCLSVAVS